MSIHILRHGRTEITGRYCGSSDIVLSAQGLAQMWAAVEGRRWTRVLTSPLRRCTAFAEAYAARYELPCTRDQRLQELHFGEWEDRSVAELHAETPELLSRFWADPAAHPPPQAEPLASLQTRVLELWNELRATSDDEALLLVSHGGPIRVLLAHLASRPLSRLLEIEVPHAALFELRVEEPA